MANTYKVEAKCNQFAGINVEFKGISNINVAFECADTLEGAFPEVSIINEETGEVMYCHYIATELFQCSAEMGKAVFKAEYDMYL